jgi:hypothetical protein
MIHEVARDSLSCELDHGNFGRTIVSDRNNRATHPCACMPQHAIVSPLAPGISSRTIGILKNLADNRQSDLSGVSVTAHIKMDSASRSFLKNLWRMGEQNFKAILRQTFYLNPAYSDGRHNVESRFGREISRVLIV